MMGKLVDFLLDGEQLGVKDFIDFFNTIAYPILTFNPIFIDDIQQS